ncbi:assimilatory sulfite reductase (NADPH) flavoprotein subunit [Saccharobesus litoralis]|uniref:Sulfite reductase [NADPH] flavoprotein alpha-component n=1 Tax=Saccharobesus litoralis TaxID=2172099 RepID=A0A2S0VVW2_9ALTE|nr:assimilatory sulfite reductase (NADPH) flavoprotein subunit [Saccharobesus litoralis]AWB68356.1 assimilatory sulfite reductase (NADPH) flavoprotein subunit [Saccharobesus litoralis]
MTLKQNNELVSPLNPQQATQLQQVVSELSPNQLSWVSGYLYGLSQANPAAAGTTPAAAAAPAGKLTILFGSQTGNTKSVANQAFEAAKAKGIDARLVSMADFKPKDIKKETHLLVLSCTQGEGDPPDDAIELHEFLNSKKAPKLDGVKYSVLALGDSSYEFFCQTGKDFDTLLGKLGGKSVSPRVDCDVEYEAPAAAWIEAAVAAMAQDLSAGVAAAPVAAGSAPVVGTSQYNKKNPFTATLETNQKITGRDSSKDIRHFEISLEESGLTYKPGDSLGVWFKNDEAVVADFITKVGLKGDETVKVDDVEVSLTDALIKSYELTLSHPGFVSKYAELTGNEELAKLADDREALRAYIDGRQLIDIVREHPSELTAEQIVSCLRRLTPRLYSIASSQAEVEEEVHLTVGVVRYDAFGEEHFGGASGFLAERLEEGGEVDVFVEESHFRLPEDEMAPVIMVGPGTGVAPFRAFMQEIDAEELNTQTWLFFGNPNFTEDFLYQVEWQDYLKRGVLNNIDLAFSRDQAEKIYVQDRMLEKAEELWAWLEKGAYFYVCGDATRMAKDVHEALVTIVEQQGGKSREDAEAYVTELRKNKRYQRDVY